MAMYPLYSTTRRRIFKGLSMDKSRNIAIITILTLVVMKLVTRYVFLQPPEILISNLHRLGVCDYITVTRNLNMITYHCSLF